MAQSRLGENQNTVNVDSIFKTEVRSLVYECVCMQESMVNHFHYTFRRFSLTLVFMTLRLQLQHLHC